MEPCRESPHVNQRKQMLPSRLNQQLQSCSGLVGYGAAEFRALLDSNQRHTSLAEVLERGASTRAIGFQFDARSTPQRGLDNH